MDIEPGELLGYRESLMMQERGKGGETLGGSVAPSVLLVVVCSI